MRGSKFLLLFVFISSVLPGFAQTEPESSFSNQFSGYKKTTEIQKVDPGADTPFQTAGLRQITRHRFKSKKAIAPRTYLSFTLFVMEYDTPANASAAFELFQANLTDQFIKTPEMITIRENTIYRLSGGCLYSADDWEAIEKQLEKAVFGTGTRGGAPKIKILCGGEVSPNADRGSPIWDFYFSSN